MDTCSTILAYTNAPPACDGPGTQDFGAVGRDGRGRPIRLVRVATEHFGRQASRNSGGGHATARLGAPNLPAHFGPGSRWTRDPHLIAEELARRPPAESRPRARIPSART